MTDDNGAMVNVAPIRVIMHIPEPRRHLVRYYGW